MEGKECQSEAGQVHGTNHFRVFLMEVICSLNLTCRVSVRLSQSLPALSGHTVFFICLVQKNIGKLCYFLMKNVTFRVLFTEGGTLWKKVPKRGQILNGTFSHFGAIFEPK